jgi:5'-3' exonuclease
LIQLSFKDGFDTLGYHYFLVFFSLQKERMGIKNLNHLLLNKSKDKGVYHYDNVEDFLSSENNRIFREKVKREKINNPIKQKKIKDTFIDRPYIVGIDAYLFAIRYKRVFKRIELGIFRQIVTSLTSKMIPIYVFDGIAPDQKKKTIMQRKNKRQKRKEELDELSVLRDESVNQDIPYENLNIDDILQNIENLKQQVLNNSSEILDENKDYLVSVILDSNSPEYSDEWETGTTYGSNYLVDESAIHTELDERIAKLKKQSVGIEPEDIRDLKQFLDLLGIPHVTAKREAEDMLALLYKNNIIDACLSDDTDMLPKGCGNIIQINRTGVTQFVLSDILKTLGFTHDQLIDLCILLGSDYDISYLPKMKNMDNSIVGKKSVDRANELFNIFVEGKSLESFVERYSETDPKLLEHLEEYKQCRELFKFSQEEIKSDFKEATVGRLSILNFPEIKKYLTSYDITFDYLNERKYKSMIQTVNQYLSSILLKIMTFIS